MPGKKKKKVVSSSFDSLDELIDSHQKENSYTSTKEAAQYIEHKTGGIIDRHTQALRNQIQKQLGMCATLPLRKSKTGDLQVKLPPRNPRDQFMEFMNSIYRNGKEIETFADRGPNSYLPPTSGAMLDTVKWHLNECQEERSMNFRGFIYSLTFMAKGEVIEEYAIQDLTRQVENGTGCRVTNRHTTLEREFSHRNPGAAGPFITAVVRMNLEVPA